MPHKYAEIAFTPQVQAVQTEQGSRKGYRSMEEGDDFNLLLGPRERAFIAARDSFYMASVSETGWPYVQHRGGAQGFVKVLNEKTLGFADFRGNRQYISVGNVRHDPRISLFFMDYPNRMRLKLFGRVRIIDGSDTGTLAQLESPDYRASVERGFLMDIEGFDWNCPQHITPRFTENEVALQIEPLQQRIRALQDIATLPTPSVLGDGPIALVISGVRQLTPRVRAYELRAADNGELPQVTAGSHIAVPVSGKDGKLLTRTYSICSNPVRQDIYEIAVLHDEQGQGSTAIHDRFQVGQLLNCQPPRNDFQLHSDNRPAVLIAGGIGITAIKAMAQSLKAAGTEFELHYAGRSRTEMAFADRLERMLPDDIFLYPADEGLRMDLNTVFSATPANAMIYVCGPERLIEATTQAADNCGIASEHVRLERFAPQVSENDQPLLLTINGTGITLDVPADQSVLDAMLDAGVNAAYSCRTGTCRTCVVTVLKGDPEHRDTALNSEERERGLFCPCVSRARGGELVVDK